MHYFRVPPAPPGIFATISFQATYPYLCCKNIILNSLAKRHLGSAPRALEREMDATSFEIGATGGSFGGGGLIFCERRVYDT